MAIIPGSDGPDTLIGTESSDSISGAGGADSLSGLGGNDTLVGGAGADTLLGGFGNDRLMGGADDDVIDSTAFGAGNDTLQGDDGADTLLSPLVFNASVEPLLEGGAGNDLLGLAGDLTASGGDGVDTFRLLYVTAYSGGVFPPAPMTMTVTDFVAGPGGDRLDSLPLLSGFPAFDGTNPFGSSGFLRLRQSDADTFLDLDRDGGGNNWVPFVRLVSVVATNLVEENLGFAPDGSSEETGSLITGTAANDSLLGTTGPDTIYGLAGGDTVIAGAGADSIEGGEGSDSLSGQAGDDTIVGHEGTLAGWFTDTLSGGAGNDSLRAGNVGPDLLVGGAGDDTMVASSSEVFPYDTASFVDAPGPVVVYLFAHTARGDGDDVLIGIKSAIGSTFSDTLVGDDQANRLEGGFGGNDLLDGRGGNDTLIGGLGDDSYQVDTQSDLAFEIPGEGRDTVIATTGLYLYANIEDLILAAGAGAIFGVGNELANRITGNDSANTLDGGAGADSLRGLGGTDSILGGLGADTLDGGAGEDSLIGGLGDDLYLVDTQADLVFENPGEGRDTVIATTGFYLYANIEDLVLATGAGAIFGVGNELANRITGNDSPNTLISWDGNDTLLGLGGNDILYAVAGDDEIDGGAGIDFLAGGEGNDTLRGGLDPDEIYGEAGDDSLVGGPDFVFDLMVGGEGADTLDGRSGNGDFDYLYGGDGNDLFVVDTPDDLVFEFAGGGNDTVQADIVGAGYYLYAEIEDLVLLGATPFGVGNELANRLTGSDAANWLLGGAGADTLNGKGGGDVLFGEGGADSFVFERGTGGDVIGDFVSGEDRLVLSGLGFADAAAVLAAFTVVGGSSAIDLGLGDFVVLNGGTAITASDIILV